MDELQQAGDVIGSASDVMKSAGALSKSLPGMAKSGGEGSAEPEICPSCNQKIVTSQPGGIDVADAADKAGSVLDCCSKAFDCFGKANDMVQEVQ